MALRLLQFGAGLLVLAAVAGSGGPAQARVDVPIEQVTLPNGDTRYLVRVSVGGGIPFQAMLDTGSFGLRVLSSAVDAARVETTDTRRAFPFNGGAVFKGALARATVGVGGATTTKPVLVQIVDDVGCTERRPDCAASKISAADYRMGGDGIPGQGFRAILGIAMRRAEVADSTTNPLEAMGGARWIVALPRPGSSEPGHLIIDPDPDERSGFSAVHLSPMGSDVDGLHGWADGALPGCFAVPAEGKRYCGKTLLDTGAPGFIVDADSVTKPTPIGGGKAALFTVDTDAGPLSLDFTTGDSWATRVMLKPVQGQRRISAGTLPFFSYSVLFDAEAGTVGFKRRS